MKTGSCELERPQVETYLDVARDNAFPASSGSNGRQHYLPVLGYVTQAEHRQLGTLAGAQRSPCAELQGCALRQLANRSWQRYLRISVRAVEITRS